MSNAQWGQDQIYAAEQERIAKESALRDRVGRETGAMLHNQLGSVIGPGIPLGASIAQMACAQGKMFTRSDILAILRAQKCINDTHRVPGMREGGDDVLRSLITIFENLE